ncbi:hypothetical protein F5141DRAFT_1213823 [Pisolithus sp. B1]|nr:hypothetical protein F5141DRAFT_1213823 [Pisolithus sp. B1]
MSKVARRQVIRTREKANQLLSWLLPSSRFLEARRPHFAYDDVSSIAIAKDGTVALVEHKLDLCAMHAILSSIGSVTLQVSILPSFVTPTPPPLSNPPSPFPAIVMYKVGVASSFTRTAMDNVYLSSDYQPRLAMPYALSTLLTEIRIRAPLSNGQVGLSSATPRVSGLKFSRAHVVSWQSVSILTETSENALRSVCEITVTPRSHPSTYPNGRGMHMMSSSHPPFRRRFAPSQTPR